MKIYCQKCGSPHSAIEKPNFCTKCGNPFNSRMAAASTPARPAPSRFSRPRPVENDSVYTEVDEDNYETEINTELAFSASKLDVDIEKDDVRPVKIESIMGTINPNDVKIEKFEGSANYSAEDFKREAGSLRT